MQYRTIGTSDVLIPTLSLGTWAMGGGDSWGPSDEKQSMLTIDQALEVGMNCIDTAPAYGNGLSEILLGKALKGKRNDCFLASKCGLIWGIEDQGSVHKNRDGVIIRRNLSPSSIRVQVEQSLRRLNTDYLDLLVTHWQSIEPFFTPIEDTVATLEALKKEGKIRFYGASNASLDQIKEYQKYGELSLVQDRFSLLSRQNQKLVEYCEQSNITFQAYSPLERGLLTGKIQRDTPVIGTAKASIPWFQVEKRAMVLDVLDRLSGMCESHHCTIGNLVIAWTMSFSTTMNVLCGARMPDQVIENAKASDITLSIDDKKFIGELVLPLLQ